jgi:hypothetical protein
MVLDIEWDAILVQSSLCEGLCESINHTGFNSSASTSFISSEDEFTLNYASTVFSGSLGEDTISIAGLDLRKQSILEATYIAPIGNFAWYFQYDGILGLSPRSKFGTSSPWQSIIRDGLLDHNMFSIQFPSGRRDMDIPRTNGELTLGSIAPHFLDADFMDLPWKESVTGSPWATDLTSLIWGDGNSLREDFEDGRAYFSTTLPHILLPGSWSDILSREIGAEAPFGFFKEFSCERRKSLPNLTFVVGGHTIVLTPFEYTFVMSASSKDVMACVIGFDSSGPNTVGLGWPFMQNFYTVFDQDAKLIKGKLLLCHQYLR